MAEQIRKSTKGSATERPSVEEPKVSEEAAEKRDVLLADIDELLDEIDEVLDTDEQQELDDARRRAEYRAKLKSLAFLGKRAVDPCSDPSVIRVPEHVAERLLSAGLAKEHDCGECD